MTNQFISNKTKKRIHKKDIFHEFKLPTIPDKIGDYIYKELKVIKKIMEKNEKYKDKKEKTNHEIISDEELDKKIRMIFLKAMIMLIGDYNNFLFYTEDEYLYLIKKLLFNHIKIKILNYSLVKW